MSYRNRRLVRTAAATLLTTGMFAFLSAGPASANHEAARNIDDACPPGQVPDAGFEDDLAGDSDDTTENTAENTQRAIDCITEGYGIAGGVGDTDGDGQPEYNPTGNVSRAQMATFIMQKLDLVEGYTRPDNAPNVFTDVPEGSTHEVNIHDAAAEGIVEGVARDTDGDGDLETDVNGDGQSPDYLPSENVSRSQMATFIVEQLRVAGADIPDPADDFPFDDVDASNVHAQNIAILHELGIFVGQADGNFGPNLPISRAQMALVIARDVDYLVEQGLIDPIGDADNAGQVVSCGDDDGFDYTFVSETGEVVAVDADSTNDQFFVDGVQVSSTVFAAQCNPGDQVTFTDDTSATDADRHELVNVDEVNEGMVGNVDLDDEDFQIINEVTGTQVNDEDIQYSVGTATFSVDGANVSEDTFEDDLSEGDFVEVTRDTNGNVTNVALTNGSLTGTATDVANNVTAATFMLDDAFGDDPRNDSNFQDTHFIAHSNSTQDFVVDGDPATLAEFMAALSNGDTVTYSREDGVETFVLENEAPPAITGQATDNFDTGANLIEVATDGDDTDVCAYSSGATFLVDGVVVTESEFESNLSPGDEITCQPGDPATGTNEVVALENENLSGTVGNVDTAADTYQVFAEGADTDDDVVLDTVDYTTAGDRYFVNGTEVNLATFEDFLDESDLTPSTGAALDPDDTMTVVNTGLAVEHRFTTDNTGEAS